MAPPPPHSSAPSTVPLHPSLPPRPSPARPSTGAVAYNGPLHARVTSTGGTGGYSQAAGDGDSRESTPGVNHSLPTRPAFLPQTPTSHSQSGSAAGQSPRLVSTSSFSGPYAVEDPYAALPPPLKADQLKPTTTLIELGEGWKVKWKAWKAPALLHSFSTAGPSTARYDYDPFGPPPGATSPFPAPTPASSTTASTSTPQPPPTAHTPTPAPTEQPPPAKKPKTTTMVAPKSAFDELLAEEMGETAEEAGAPKKKKGRVPKAVREAQAAQAAQAAAATAPTPRLTPAPLTPALDPLPAAIDLPFSAPPLEVSTSASSSQAAPPVAGPSAARAIKDRFSSLPSATAAAGGEDPIAKAEREVKRFAEEFAMSLSDVEEEEEEEGEEGQKDKLALFSFVKVAPVRLGVMGKEKDTKGKRKDGEGQAEVGENNGDEGGAAEGRILWVFSVVRGGSGADNHDDDGAFAEIEFEGLQAVATGHFTHLTLFPSLYPTANRPPISLLDTPARSFPSALAISAQVLTVPSFAHPVPAETHLQAAYTAFREAIRGVLLDELVALPPASPPSTTAYTGGRLKVQDSVIYLPSSPPPNLSRIPRPASSAPLAVVSTLCLPSLNRSSLVLQPKITEQPYASLPPGPIRRGAPVLLAPGGVKAFLTKSLSGLSDEAKAKLRAEWSDRLRQTEEEDWVLCTVDPPSPPTPPPSSKGKERAREKEDRVEVVWPRSLVILDGSRTARTPSNSRSRSRSKSKSRQPVEEGLKEPKRGSSDTDELSSSPASSPEQRSAVLQLAIAEGGPGPFQYPFPFSPSRPPRPPFDGQFRRHLASRELAGRCLRRLAKTTYGGDTMELGSPRNERTEEEVGYRDPIRRCTAQVWGWMGDEVRRREKEEAEQAREEQREKEREREREREREKEKERERERESEKALEDGKRRAAPPPASAPPLAAAPLNMRTPASLGSAGGEACSPAELFTSLATTSGANLLPPHSSASATLPLETDMLDLGVYPSPAEPISFPPTEPAVAASTGLSTLDAAFSAFDWGDGAFASTGNGASALEGTSGSVGRSGEGQGAGGEYDDGMMLGLTDDDFSFFDTPAADTTLPHSMPMTMDFDLAPQDPLLTPFSTAPDLLGTSTSPDFSAFASAFDPGPAAPNALGLSSSSSGAPPSIVASMPAFEGLAQLPTMAPDLQHLPLSPVVLPSANLAASAVAPFSYSSPSPPLQAPHPPITVSLDPYILPDPATSFSRASPFDPVPFASSHTAADAKYDAAKRGKFGLPSPDSDSERSSSRARRDLLELLPAAVGKRPVVKSRSELKDKKEPDRRNSWFEVVCDPRIPAAERIRDGRTRRKAPKQEALLRSHTWVRPKLLGLPLAPFGGEDGEPSTAHTSTDEASATESSDSDEGQVRLGRRRKRVDCDWEEGRVESFRVAGDSDELDRRAQRALGASLLVFGAYLNGVISRSLPLSHEEAEKAPPQAVDAAREIAFAIVADQAMYNTEFRQATLALCRPTKGAGAPVSSSATLLAATVLQRACEALSPSPLFADHAVLPSLAPITPPSILLRTQQCIVQARPAALSFWRPMGFEPLAGRKDVTAFAVYEDDGQGMHQAVREWLQRLSGVYQNLRLGEHSHGTITTSSSSSGIREGLVPFPRGALTSTHERDELKLLYATLVEHAKTTQNTVVYVISRFADSPLSVSSPITSILHQIGKSRTPVVSMHPVPVPLSSIIRSGPSFSNHGDGDGLLHLAFSLYDQLQIPVGRLRIPAPETFPTARPAPVAALGPAVRLFQAPAITLSPSPSKAPQVQFALNWPASSLEVEHRHRLLHVCYGSKRVGSGDATQEWLAVSLIDEKGEVWKNMPRCVKIPPGVVADVHLVRVVWSFSKALVDAADVEWRVVICKLGEPTAIEAKAWDSLLKEHLAISKRPLHVTFACADLDPSFSLTPAVTSSPHSPFTATLAGDNKSSSVPGSVSKQVGGKVTLFDDQASAFAFTPSEPVSLASLHLLAPISTYIVHVPRISSFSHSSIELFQPSTLDSIAPISAYGIHFLLSHASRTSCYNGTLGELVADVQQSYVELATLGQVRWGASGRLSWHLEAAKQALELVDHL
ncbi:hypothetical protein JCM11641_004204 [Rhodosporidiobolus odoratus]